MLKEKLNNALIILLPFKKHFIAFGCIFFLLSFLTLFNFSLSDNLSDASYEDYFNGNNKIFSIRVPKDLNFAGEVVPISDFRIHKAVETELVKGTYWQSRSLVLHKRASRWFPVIEPILKKNNIPDDFKYIALIESQLTNVVSPQGATGFWQIIESTAKGYGLEITDEVDERYHVVKSTEAACKYFLESYKHFNNWTLVAASYNLGMNGIQVQLNKQNVSNYYDLHLTKETAQYVYRLLAMKEIISRPKIYGFLFRTKDKYRPVAIKYVTVDSSIYDLSEFAIAQGINYSILKLFNPWLIANTLTNTPQHVGLIFNEESASKRKKYIFEIPKEKVIIYEVDLNDGHEEIKVARDSGHLITHLPKNTDSTKLAK